MGTEDARGLNGLQDWGASEGQEAFALVLERLAGPEIADRYRAPWSFPDPERLAEVVKAGGFADGEVRVEAGDRGRGYDIPGTGNIATASKT